MSTPKKPTKRQWDKEQKAECLRWHHVALCFGYNELAKKGNTLGEKLYFRLAAGLAEDEFKKAGGEVELLDKGATTLVLRGSMPHLKLLASDASTYVTVTRRMPSDTIPKVERTGTPKVSWRCATHKGKIWLYVRARGEARLLAA